MCPPGTVEFEPSKRIGMPGSTARGVAENSARGALVTDTAAVAVLEAPPLSVTVNTTLKVPARAQEWPTSGPDTVPRLPASSSMPTSAVNVEHDPSGRNSIADGAQVPNPLA